MYVGIKLLIATIIGLNVYNPSRLYVQAAFQELYTGADDVVILNSTTFTPTVFHQNKNITFVVEFYNTFCGHCQAFAPIYKDIATRSKNWTSVVQITALDCAKDENLQTCVENKVSGYPTILFFPPNANQSEPSDGPLDLRSLSKPWTVDDIEECIIDYVANQTSRTSGHSLVSEALQPITSTDLSLLERIYSPSWSSDGLEEGNKLQDLMIVVENDSYLGRKLILQYYRIRSRLEVRRVNLTNVQFLRSILTDEEFNKLNDAQPLLVKIADDESKDSKAIVLVRGEEKHVLPTSDASERADFIFGRFNTFLDHYYSIELNEISPHIPNSSRPPPDRAGSGYKPDDKSIVYSDKIESIQRLIYSFEASNRTVFAIDLLHAIAYIMTHEVPIKGDLTIPEYNTVRNLLTIFLKYLPLEAWDAQLHAFLHDMRTHLDKERVVYEKHGILAKQMQGLLELSGSRDLSEKYKKQNWVSCLRSEIQQKGYTCSVWLLFHTLTVSEYLKAAPVLAHPSLVLETMRDYITHFFGCTVCAVNFRKETESLETSLQYRNSSVIWLWSTHNSVRERLNNEKLVGAKSLSDILYPLYKSCPSCFKTNLEEIGRKGETLSNIQWDYGAVFNYLLNTYRPDKVISPAIMETYQSKILSNMNSEILDDLDGNRYRVLDLSAAEVDANRSSGQSSIFSTSDISLCLFLYLTCIVIVAIVCVSMNPRLKHLKMV